MRHLYLAFCVLGAFASSVFADLTIHVQSPFIEEMSIHLVLNSAEPDGSKTSSTVMQFEGEKWYSYTWKRSLSSFKASDTFTIMGCLETSTRNLNCDNFGEGITYNVRDFFEGSNEAWIYTDSDANTYTKSFSALGSKIVWFKSPWGNKALPQMIFGQDTILMHYSKDADKCGWFYGALSPEILGKYALSTAHFTRFNAPWMSVPQDKKQIIDLANALEKDTLYVDGTTETPEISNIMGTLGECFDNSRTLHIYNPWRNNSVYRDSSVYVTVDGIRDETVGENVGPAQTSLAFDQGYKYWLSVDFSDSLASSAAWKSDNAKVQITRSFTEQNITARYFSVNNSLDNRPIISNLFPPGVYETWFFASSTMEKVDISYAPLERKVIRLLSPWKNTPTSFIVQANDDDVVRMSTFSKDTCGWFEGVYYKHAADWNVYFKQSFGLEKYSMNGIVKEGLNVDVFINLDTLLSKRDTAWVYPSGKSYSGPEVSAVFPNKLGECPSMKISAMILDWAGESYHDSIDIDFGHTHGGNDFTAVGEYKTCNTGEKITGMVKSTLVNGLPARVDSTKFPWDKCAAGHEIDKWFIPQVVATVGTKQYTNSVCKDIPLELDDEGFWFADYTNESGDCNDPVSPGFFPLDDFEYLDSAKTIKNPKFDWDVSGYVKWAGETNYKLDTCKHNYSYAMAVSASFKYVKGQYFEFRGDDDVWVFINNRLVVDIGGIHEKVEGAVNLDTIGQNEPSFKLVEGREYPFNIFYAERNATGSNFKMRTSINLQRQNTLLEFINDSNRYVKGELKLKMDAEAISCDPSAKAQVDTADAPSIFYLDGGSLADSKLLTAGVINFGGILINKDSSGFSIDIDEIVKQRSLGPGTYTLYYFLASDMALNGSYEFTVPPFETPEIAFVDVFNSNRGDKPTVFDPKNKTLRGETIQVGVNDTLMTHVHYPEMKLLKVMVTYMGEICKDCYVVLDLVPSDPRIVFYNELDSLTNTIVTDDDGFAYFYVVSEAEMSGASFAVVGVNGVKNQLKWENLNFRDPEMPLAKTGSIYDRNGDGVPDSIYIPFEFDAFKSYSLDSIAWTFGDKSWHQYSSMKNDFSKFVKDSSVIITADSLLDSVFTGDAKNIVEGSFLYQYMYQDEESSSILSDVMITKIQDKIGAIMLEKPMLKIPSGNYVKVTVKLSEACKLSDIQTIQFFELRDKNDDFIDPSKYKLISVEPRGESDYYDLLFERSMEYIVPEVGYKIRLIPGLLPDKSGNTPHEKNPWRRIEGEQPLQMERPKVVTIRPGMFDDKNPWPGDTNDVVPVRVDEGLTLKEIIQEKGLPGVLIKFKLDDFATTMLLGKDEASREEILSKVKVKWDIEFFSSLGQYVNWVKGEFACNDKSIFETDCTLNPGNMFFMWDAMSEKGRMVGTGVYIAKFKFKIFSDLEIMGKGEEIFTFGVRRDLKYKTSNSKKPSIEIIK